MSRQPIVLIKVNPNAVLPTRATPGSFGYDITVPDTVTIPAGAVQVIPIGWKLGLDLPLGAAAHLDENGQQPTIGGEAMWIVPRGSTALKKGLLVSNSPGLVDADYTGEIGVIVYNFKSEPVTINAGERIAQMVFLWTDFWPLVEGFESSARPERLGFGSTGQ